MSQSSVLFVLKKRQDYNDKEKCYSHGGRSSGLLNSVKFVVDMLRRSGVKADLVQVVDNNDIDREVTRFKPTHVVVEALWVVPEKFNILHKLHPDVQWIVRVHSALAFLSGEGIALDWIAQYVTLPKVAVASNHKGTAEDLRHMVSEKNPQFSDRQLEEKVLFLPNYYALRPKLKAKGHGTFVDIGCFGAIRPLKNQLMQASAAMVFASKQGKRLRFHINGSRCERGGETVLKNLRAMFADTAHVLIEHVWRTHEDFIRTLKVLDIGMQVSFSETFNIVSADYLQAGLPIVVSSEVLWASPFSKAPTTSTEDIARSLALNTGILRSLIYSANARGLESYNQNSREIWLKQFKKICQFGK